LDLAEGDVLEEITQLWTVKGHERLFLLLRRHVTYEGHIVAEERKVTRALGMSTRR
jgi:hypothetical protein